MKFVTSSLGQKGFRLTKPMNTAGAMARRSEVVQGAQRGVAGRPG